MLVEIVGEKKIATSLDVLQTLAVELLSACRIEVLIPDFHGNEAALRTVLDARPDVLNHNTETVPRLYRMARSGGRYSRTLELLDRSRHHAPHIPTKTGLMVGLGEEHDELVATFEDLRGAVIHLRRRATAKRKGHLDVIQRRQ